MTIDDDTLKQLLRINDELMQLCKFLNEKRDMETSSRLIPLVDDLTHILIEAGKNKYTDDDLQPYKGYFIDGSAMPVHPFTPDWYVGGSVLVPGRGSSIVEITRFQLQQFTVSIKELAEWFGVEVARIVVDECLPSQESEWQSTSNAPVPSVPAIWESCCPNRIVQAINGRCLKCGYRLAWVLVRGKTLPELGPRRSKAR